MTRPPSASAAMKSGRPAHRAARACRSRVSSATCAGLTMLRGCPERRTLEEKHAADLDVADQPAISALPATCGPVEADEQEIRDAQPHRIGRRARRDQGAAGDEEGQDRATRP